MSLAFYNSFYEVLVPLPTGRDLYWCKLSFTTAWEYLISSSLLPFQMEAEDVKSLLCILSAGTCSTKSQLICDSQLCDKASQEYPSSLLCSSRQALFEDIGKMSFLPVPPFTLNQTRQGPDHAILHAVFIIQSPHAWSMFYYQGKHSSSTQNQKIFKKWLCISSAAAFD